MARSTALPKAKPSSLPGSATTKWRTPAATDGPNYSQTGLSKNRFASKAAMKPPSPRSLRVPAELLQTEHSFRRSAEQRSNNHDLIESHPTHPPMAAQHAD